MKCTFFYNVTVWTEYFTGLHLLRHQDNPLREIPVFNSICGLHHQKKKKKRGKATKPGNSRAQAWLDCRAWAFMCVGRMCVYFPYWGINMML
jgi:hypothetical protein